MSKSLLGKEYNQLLGDLKLRVAESRHKAALSVNKKLIFLYHHIGTSILESQEKHGWGAKVINQLSTSIPGKCN